MLDTQKMKILLVLNCAFILCSAEIDKDFVMKFVEKIKKVSDACVAETKATQDDVKSLLEHKTPETHEGQCLIFCFHKNFNIQNDDGSVNKEGALTSLEPIKEHSPEVYDKVVNIFNTCSESAASDSDPCVYAKNLAECAIREGKSLGLEELIVIE